MPKNDDTISPDDFANRSTAPAESVLLLPFVIVKDAIQWVRDAIRQRGLPD